MFHEGTIDYLSDIFTGKIKNDLFDDFDESDTNPPPSVTASKRPPTPENTTDESEIKRLRIKDVTQAQPIVSDSFEEESTRQVTNVPGLQAPTTAESSQLVLNHQIRHQVALPLNFNYKPISQHVSPANPARSYPFSLDPFQRVAIASIERNESVLVSAHTSAGKTVVAEYAIAQCLKNKQRVIYTSPIKALSNQKFREFTEEFGDVGLMTGDVTINPQASCLVMTTEILRSMLYRGSEVILEVAWVVYDEIHYMRDSVRGVVWEESIILLPHSVRYVFLSATIPNAMEFSEWICKTHEQPCHVVYTDFRPTPLQHYLFPAASDGIHLVVDEKGIFREDNFTRAIAGFGTTQLDGGGIDKKGSGGGNDIYRIIKMIMMKHYHPVIIFCFSKKECEGNAIQLSKLNFNDRNEQDMVSQIFKNAIASLDEADQILPPIQQLLPLLKRGIGIHHGGLLPIMKETIEILFQENLLKVLFATETFSIGLNMPAKTVLFTSVEKFDGISSRWLSSGEYIQMSGRAGRRGLDERGVVIMMIDSKIEPGTAKEMITGESDCLNSAFHLSYNMILNLLRVEGISPEFMLERCFHTFQNASSIPKFELELFSLEQKKNAIIVEHEKDIQSYYEIRQQIDSLAENIRQLIINPIYCLPFMQTGRLIHIKLNDTDFGWGVAVRWRRIIDRTKLVNDPESCYYMLDVLLICAANSLLSKDSQGRPVGIYPSNPSDDETTMLLVPLRLDAIYGISRIRLKLPMDYNVHNGQLSIQKSLNEICKRFGNQVPVLDPIVNMGITDPVLGKLVNKIILLEKRLTEHPLAEYENLHVLYEIYGSKIKISAEIRDMKRKITKAKSIVQLDELKNRKRLMRRLGFITVTDVVEMKGRVACEINTGDELLLTEMMFEGVFNDLTVDQCVALLSCFVFDEKAESSKSKLQAELAGPLHMMQETARKIVKISIECKLMMDEEVYLAKFKPQLMDTVYAWCKGANFSQICQMTEVYEGSLVRIFRRLEELLYQMASAAKCIGNSALENKFSEGVNRIHRDIIFAASLYL